MRKSHIVKQAASQCWRGMQAFLGCFHVVKLPDGFGKSAGAPWAEPGSGRRGGRELTADYRRLDVQQLQRASADTRVARRLVLVSQR